MILQKAPGFKAANNKYPNIPIKHEYKEWID